MAILAAAAAGGCSGGGRDATDAISSPTVTAAVSSAEVAETRPEPTTLRDRDTIDIAAMADEVAAGAEGDAEWIQIFAPLRVQSWLLARYPGRFDVHEVYTEEWAEGTATVNQQEAVDRGLYLDQPLPELISLDRTRTIGELVELEVVIRTDEAFVRQAADDQVVRVIDATTSRGLFTLGPTGAGGAWRIHSVVELQLADESTTEQTTTDVTVGQTTIEETSS